VSHAAGLAEVFLASGAAVGAAVLALWLVSLAIRDASIVDVFWGLGYVGIAWIAFALGDGDPGRRLAVTVGASLWGLRLAGHLAWRNHGAGEDPRYARMRSHHGPRFWIVSLATVFALQGALMLVISLPIQVAQAVAGPPLGPLDGAGLALVVTGLGLETVADLQLARFRADPSQHGRVLDRGLWRYSRHPNYFGDAVVWWGLWLVACSVPWGLWTIVSPALMTFLLLRVSGVALLERGLARSKPGWAEYAARTSAFVPWPPRTGRGAS
jgi:steroid 5-alpha reductase family enzyme